MSIFLTIDSCDPERVVCSVRDRTGKKERTFAQVTGRGKRGMRSNLLLFVQRALQRTKKNVRDLDSISVVPGPGPFTSVRTGVVVANALAWALGVSVHGIKKKRGARFHPVMPVYGGEPNITASSK